MRIHISGGPGCGISSLGMLVAEEINSVYFDTDDYEWEKTEIPFTVKREPKVRDRLLLKDLKKTKNWILVGCINGWDERIIEMCHLAVFVLTPPDLKIERIVTRDFCRYGNDMLNNPDIKKFTLDRLDYILDYDLCTGLSERNIETDTKWFEERTSSTLKFNDDVPLEHKAFIVINHLERSMPKLKK